MANNATKRLIVPVHLDGICVGKNDLTGSINLLAPPTTDFKTGIGQIPLSVNSDSTSTSTPYLGDGNVSAPFETSGTSKPGVQLHWAFPAAMTHGRNKYQITDDVVQTLQHKGFTTAETDLLNSIKGVLYDNATEFQAALSRALTGKALWYQFLIEQAAVQVIFPSLPNRWVVVRLASNATLSKAWLIQSDYLSTQNLYDKTAYSDSSVIPSPFLPEDDKSKQKHFIRYMGRVRALDEKWPADKGEVCPELNALGFGTLSFAGYLQNSKNVFSFLDAGADLPAGQMTELSYVVVGWYSDKSKDPLDQKTAEQIRQLLADNHWTLPGYTTGFDSDPAKAAAQKQANSDLTQQIAGSLFCGMLKGVQWKADHAYLKAPTAGTDAVKVVLGNTPAECLAAYIANVAGGQTGDIGGLLPEEALNALQMGILPKLKDALEKEAVFQEAAHTATFGAENGGYLWQISPKQPQPDPNMDPGQNFDEQMRSKQDGARPLPESLALLLNKLNETQQAFDKARYDLESQRSELYAHWYWYNKWSYNPVFGKGNHNPTVSKANDLANKRMKPIIYSFPKSWADILKTPKLVMTAKKRVPDFNQNLGYQEYMLGQSMKDIAAQLQAIQTSLVQQKLDTWYQLRLVPAPRFWHSVDPVVMIADAKGLDSSRVNNPEGRGFLSPTDAGADGEGTNATPPYCRLPEQVLNPAAGQFYTLTAQAKDDLSDEVCGLANMLIKEAAFLTASDLSAVNPGKTVSSGATGIAPARMARTDWGTPAAATADGVSRDNPWHPIMLEYELNYHYLLHDKGYSQDFITARQDLDQNHIDLKYKAGTSTLSTTSTPYQGRVILSHRAFDTLQNQLDQMTELSPSNDPVAAALKTLAGKVSKAAFMTQALNGFQDNLITRDRSVQLPVYDPYDPDRTKYKNVRSMVGRQRQSAPSPLNIYNPINCGFVEISKLRIIDAFGQYRIIDQPSVIQPLTMLPANRAVDGKSPIVVPSYFALPPRLVQPARLSFRWLSATNDKVEMNAHPASSPICGWVVSNHLDDSLMIFDQAGKHLGALQAFADDQSNPVWTPAPQTTQTADSISNPHVKAFVKGFLGGSSSDFNTFRSTIERVLLTIEPASYRQHSSMAVLIGRPLALVQAELQLELKGIPAKNWNEKSFIAYANSTAKSPVLPDEQFTSVQFPVRLGDLSLSYDGLVGYFKYDRKGMAPINNSSFQAEDAAASLLLSPADADPTKIIMLIDPRAKIHATTGILPIKAIEIPPAMYADALKQMEFSFLANPVLSPQPAAAGSLKLPVPAETSRKWTWLGASTGERLTPQASGLSADLSFPPLGLYEGWLKVEPNEPETKSN